MADYELLLPLGISKYYKAIELNGLQQVLKHLKWIRFNLARTTQDGYQITLNYRVYKVEVNASSQTRSLVEYTDVVGGLIGDRLRLSRGEYVQVVAREGSASLVRLRFTDSY